MSKRNVRYRSIADMSRVVRENLSRLPTDLDFVVGVPRSGILPATMIALYCGLPMTDLEGLLEGRMIKTGKRPVQENLSKPRPRVLVVDDSVSGGEQMRAIRERLSAYEDRFEMLFLAVFVTEAGKQLVDFALELCPSPRCFEWNVMNHGLMQRSCVDVAALLCMDLFGTARVPHETLLATAPVFRPKYTIGTLTAPVAEARRRELEAWLDRHGIAAKRLMLMSGGDHEVTRRGYANLQGKLHGGRNVTMVFQYARRDAVFVASRCGRPAFSSESFELIQPGRASRMRRYATRGFQEACARFGATRSVSK